MRENDLMIIENFLENKEEALDVKEEPFEKIMFFYKSALKQLETQMNIPNEPNKPVDLREDAKTIGLQHFDEEVAKAIKEVVNVYGIKEDTYTEYDKPVCRLPALTFLLTQLNKEYYPIQFLS